MPFAYMVWPYIDGLTDTHFSMWASLMTGPQSQFAIQIRNPNPRPHGSKCRSLAHWATTRDHFVSTCVRNQLDQSYYTITIWTQTEIAHLISNGRHRPLGHWTTVLVFRESNHYTNVCMFDSKCLLLIKHDSCSLSYGSSRCCFDLDPLPLGLETLALPITPIEVK